MIDVFVACHLHYCICERMSLGLLSKLQEGMYEPGRQVTRGGCCSQNPPTAGGQGLPMTCTPTLNWFLQGHQGSQREILPSYKPSKILRLFVSKSAGRAFEHEMPTRAGPITSCGGSTYEVISERQHWRSYFYPSPYHHHLLTGSCLFWCHISNATPPRLPHSLHHSRMHS